MIGRKVVLILGAGCSADIGYPTGVKLRKHILEKLESNTAILSHLKRIHPDQKIDEFKKRLKRRGITTIDNFLQNLPSLHNVGRSVIAAILMHYENEEKLMEELVINLSKEKGEGEKVVDFESRVVKDLLKIFDVEDSFNLV